MLGREPITFEVEPVYIAKGSITLSSLNGGAAYTLRDFQELVVRKLGNSEKKAKVIAVEAPTGSGKTFVLLAPLISNILYGTRYEGAAGVYPTKPLVNDQFLSLIRVLDSLGQRDGEPLAGVDGSELAIRWRAELRACDAQKGSCRDSSVSLALVRLTGELLDRLKGRLADEEGRLTLLRLIKRYVMDADYVIVVAVPEYPYLMLSSLYRAPEAAAELLRRAIDINYVYDLMKKAVEDENYAELLRAAKRELRGVLGHKVAERELLNAYAALFSEVLFFDEFHVWSMYERPTALALILLHYLEFLRGVRPEGLRIILSSATPQEDFYELLKELGLGPVDKVRAGPAKAGQGDLVRSRTIIKFVPISLRAVRAGPAAWSMIEEKLPELVRELANEMVEHGRAIVLLRRNYAVEQAAEEFYKATGRTPTVVTGVRTGFPGKEELERRKEGGELYLFGNFAVELGIDLRRVPFGIIYGTYVGELVQRLGRVGRGDVQEATVYVPMPSAYEGVLRRLQSELGSSVTYDDLVNKVLPEAMPRELGVQRLGNEFVMNHVVGKLRLYTPLAAYMLAMLAMWEYLEDYRRLAAEFRRILEALGLYRLEFVEWLNSGKVSKEPEVLAPLASFRLAAQAPYERPLEGGNKVVTDWASLSTILGNYEVDYRDGKFVIRDARRARAADVLRLRCQPLRSCVGRVVPFRQFINGCCLTRAGGGEALLEALSDLNPPVYVAYSEGEGGVFDVLHAFGYAVEVELSVGDGRMHLLLL